LKRNAAAHKGMQVPGPLQIIWTIWHQSYNMKLNMVTSMKWKFMISIPLEV